MTTAYQIWGLHKAIDNPNQVCFIVTEGGLGLFSIGYDDQFIDNLLSDLGVGGVVTDWVITPYRSYYHSEYIDIDEEWQDRWYIIWKAQIEFDLIPDLIPINKPCIGTNASWQDHRSWPKNDEPIGCLVVSDFRDELSCQDAKDEILADSAIYEYQKRYDVCSPTVDIYMVYGENGKEYTQLLIDLGEFDWQFYAQGADYAHHMMKICTSHKGEINYLHLELD